nr:hypothetical protein CFP56_10201 [Quercus suber]
MVNTRQASGVGKFGIFKTANTARCRILVQVRSILSFRRDLYRPPKLVTRPELHISSDSIVLCFSRTYGTARSRHCVAASLLHEAVGRVMAGRSQPVDLQGPLLLITGENDELTVPRKRTSQSPSQPSPGSRPWQQRAA